MIFSKNSGAEPMPKNPYKWWGIIKIH